MQTQSRLLDGYICPPIKGEVSGVLSFIAVLPLNFKQLTEL